MAEDKKSPSPTPAMHRPTKSMARSEAAAAKIEPKQKTAPPRAAVRVREKRSARAPAASDDSEAVIRIDETTRPCKVGEFRL